MIAAVHRPTIADAFRSGGMRWDLTPWFTMVRSDPTRWCPGRDLQREVDRVLTTLPPIDPARCASAVAGSFRLGFPTMGQNPSAVNPINLQGYQPPNEGPPLPP